MVSGSYATISSNCSRYLVITEQTATHASQKQKMQKTT